MQRVAGLLLAGVLLGGCAALPFLGMGAGAVSGGLSWQELWGLKAQVMALRAEIARIRLTAEEMPP